MNPYDNFHKSTRVQKKIISENNFTYFNGIKILKRLLNKNDKLKILDFGCGVGTISLYLANLGHEVTSIDISNKAIDQAKKSAEFLGLSNKKLFNNSKNAILYFRKIKYNYIVEKKHITFQDLAACGFKDIKEFPKNINDLLNNVLNGYHQYSTHPHRRL